MANSDENLIERGLEYDARRGAELVLDSRLGTGLHGSVIEMTIVTRPSVLDFGGAYLDRPPQFSPEVLSDWQREKEEQLESHWPEVEAILSDLRQLGIYVVDVNAQWCITVAGPTRHLLAPTAPAAPLVTDRVPLAKASAASDASAFGV